MCGFQTSIGKAICVSWWLTDLFGGFVALFGVEETVALMDEKLG
jgi:hypothetical protein